MTSSIRTTISQQPTFVVGSHLRNRILCTSTGFAPVDALLGGSATIGSIICIEEDRERTYASILLKYLLAEGCVHQHGLFVGSSRHSSIDQMLTEIPIEVAKSKTVENAVKCDKFDTEQMKIAWRYQSVGQIRSDIGRNMSTRLYDLSTHRSIDDLSSCRLYRFSFSTTPTYRSLFNELKILLESDEYCRKSMTTTLNNIGESKPKKNILRIAIEGIGSPMWEDHDDMAKFLLMLRMLLRNSCAIALLTVCVDSLESIEIEKMRIYSDAVFRFETYPSDTIGRDIDQFHGRFIIVKLPSICMLSTPIPESVDLGFRLKRSRLEIQIMHLPPMISIQSSSSNNTDKISVCSSGNQF